MFVVEVPRKSEQIRIRFIAALFHKMTVVTVLMKFSLYPQHVSDGKNRQVHKAVS
jgi:hypothetical protein